MSRLLDGYELERIQKVLEERYDYYRDGPVDANRVMVIDNYISDGPGYAGAVYLVVHGEPHYVTVITECDEGLEIITETTDDCMVSS